MKALLLLAAIAGASYVGYSYSSTDGESCLVCPMTGEPVFTSAQPEAGPCCSEGTASMLTGIGVKASSCCSEATGSCCSKGETEALLTSASDPECDGNCEKGCCKDKEAAVDVTETQEETAAEGAEEVAVELTEAE
jgi:hypothetical protein